MKTQPHLYILVGLPGVGKSYWVNEQIWKDECVILSSDNLIEEYALSQNKTYDEVFAEYINVAQKGVNSRAIEARKNNQSVIWDQTNLTVNSRRKRMAALPNHKHIFVVFNPPSDEEHTRRLASRNGKTISASLIESMRGNYVEPTMEEGCAEIWYVE